MRTILEASLGKDQERREGAIHSDADEKARVASQLSRDSILRLKGEIESLHRRMRALEEEWAVAKGRASILGKSWLPGKFNAKRLPADEFLRAEMFGDNGADLHGARITYHLFTSPEPDPRP